MASTGITNGTLIAIYKDVAGTLTKIANATSNDFSITKDMIEAVTIVMTSNVSGDLKLSGSAFFNELNLTAPQNDVATFTASIQGTGALTVGTI